MEGTPCGQASTAQAWAGGEMPLRLLKSPGMGSFVFLDQFPYPVQERSLWVILIVAHLLD